MKKAVRQFREKAINALILSIDHFNRPWDQGRTEAVLIMFDHSFEMLLKAAILHRRGKIRKPRERQTIGFGDCVRKGRTDVNLKILNDEQALTLQAIHEQRNATYHHLIDISEHHLYFYAQSGITLFRDIHDDVFEEKLIIHLPERVLPISTTAPKDLSALFDNEVNEVKKLLSPGTRTKMEAMAKVRSLSTLENAVNGNYGQPGDRELEKICKRISGGEAWKSVFPGVALINISSAPEGATINFRLTRNAGVPIHLLKEERMGAVVALRRVNETDFYNLGAKQLAKKVGITVPKLVAIVDYRGIRTDEDYYKEIRIGSTVHKRYSQHAIRKIQNALVTESIEEIWVACQKKRKK